MRWKFAVLPVVLIAFVFPRFTLSADAKEFEPHNKNFTIMIPAGEHTGHQTKVLHIGKDNVPVEFAQCKADDGTIYLGASIGLPVTALHDVPRDQRLDYLGDILVKAQKGDVTDKKDIVQDPVNGKQYDMTTPTGAARLQLYNVGGWVMYAVVESTTKEGLDSKDATDFLASFKLSDRIKDVQRKKNAK